MIISMILGVMIGLGIFAAKTGLGLSTGMAWIKKKKSFLIMVCALYGLLFWGAWRLLSTGDMDVYLPHLMGLIQTGTKLHLIMAAFMLVWGLWLLGRKPEKNSGSKGWLLLVLPCPLCMTVIGCTTAMLMAAFPDHARMLSGLLYLLFIVILLLTLKTVDRLKDSLALAPETLLGGAMVMLAVYFFISITMMPHMAELENVYRLACYQGSVHGSIPEHTLIFLAIIAICFLTGFIRTMLTLRERTAT